MDDSLNNIPNLGPARRTALEAAGITTRAQLAQAAVDQLIAVTGMPRSAAEKTWAFLHPDPVASSQDVPPAAEVLAAQSALDILVPVSLAPKEENGTHPVEKRAHLEAVLMQVDTALSDATRGTPPRSADSKLKRQLTKFAVLIDDLPGQVDQLKPKQVREMTKQLQAAKQSLSRFAATPPLPDKKQEKAREAVREQRKKIEVLLASAKPSPKPAKPASQSAKAADKAVSTRSANGKKK